MATTARAVVLKKDRTAENAVPRLNLTRMPMAPPPILRTRGKEAQTVRPRTLPWRANVSYHQLGQPARRHLMLVTNVLRNPISERDCVQTFRKEATVRRTKVASGIVVYSRPPIGRHEVKTMSRPLPRMPRGEQSRSIAKTRGAKVSEARSTTPASGQA